MEVLFIQEFFPLISGARDSAFRSVKTIAECLADELINAAKVSDSRLSVCSWALN